MLKPLSRFICAVGVYGRAAPIQLSSEDTSYSTQRKARRVVRVSLSFFKRVALPFKRRQKARTAT